LLVHGQVADDRGEIRKPVGRDPVRRTRMKVGGLRARAALTRYRVIRRFPRLTLLEAKPETGRTHQIRVHFASIGHPIVGDTLYGAPAKLRLGGREVPTLARTFLHAAGLGFLQPQNKKLISVETPLPPDLEDFLSMVVRLEH
jgi:23S rRNA pseudouridine1911/1915/1917 synthase